MKRILFIAISFALLLPNWAYPIDLLVGTGGYTGKYQVGVKKKAYSLVYGNTSGDGQLSLTFQYPVNDYLHVGGFISYSLDNKFYVKSPSKYPSSSYYEQTAFRSGLVFELRYKIFYINTNILDTGIGIIINEREFRDNFGWMDGRLWSTGAGLIIPF